jgi:hypothetical protein
MDRLGLRQEFVSSARKGRGHRTHLDSSRLRIDAGGNLAVLVQLLAQLCDERPEPHQAGVLVGRLEDGHGGGEEGDCPRARGSPNWRAATSTDESDTWSRCAALSKRLLSQRTRVRRWSVQKYLATFLISARVHPHHLQPSCLNIEMVSISQQQQDAIRGLMV